MLKDFFRSSLVLVSSTSLSVFQSIDFIVPYMQKISFEIIHLQKLQMRNFYNAASQGELAASNR